MFSNRALRVFAITASVLVLLVIGIAAIAQRSKADLSPWHTVKLDGEFRAGDLDGGFGWNDYLELESDLFRELELRVVRPSVVHANPAWNRYADGGVNNPEGFPRNWNRSFELTPSEPVGGALLIHGLTDSPYSLRRTAEILHEQGYRVVGLRLPGHGTTPAELRRAEVADWRAAARIAYDHLVSSVEPDSRIIVAGYSNGGALALDLALDSLDDDGMRTPDRVVLFSPAIGITRAAALARLPRLLNWMPWFSKLGWGSIEPELDPFKYSSFPNDAGYLTHVLTTSVRGRLAEIQGQEIAERFPPVLTFMSLADATVMVEAVVDGLHERLVDGDSELVIFDINRQAKMRDLFRVDPADRLTSLISRRSTPYRLTVISNMGETSDALVEWSRPAGATEPSVTPLQLAWPPGFYSLSHVAIPFPPDDPIYGYLPPSEGRFGIQLGRLEPRGERGLLTLPAGQFDRLRSNPFFPYIERRLVEIAEGHRRGTAGTPAEDPGEAS
jgi:alpha-beta hydrolase superfamily lysophospholipase